MDVVYRVNRSRNDLVTKEKSEFPSLSMSNIAMISLRRLSGESSSTNHTNHTNHQSKYKHSFHHQKKNKHLPMDNIPLLEASDNSRTCSDNSDESDQESVIEYDYGKDGMDCQYGFEWSKGEVEEMDTPSDNSVVHYDEQMDSLQTPSFSIPTNPHYSKGQQHGAMMMLSNVHTIDNSNNLSPSSSSSSFLSPSSSPLNGRVEKKQSLLAYQSLEIPTKERRAMERSESPNGKSNSAINKYEYLFLFTL